MTTGLPCGGIGTDPSDPSRGPVSPPPTCGRILVRAAFRPSLTARDLLPAQVDSVEEKREVSTPIAGLA